MKRLIALMVLAITPAAMAAPVPAGKPTAIPAEIPVLAKSMVVFQLNGVESTKQKVKSFLTNAFPKEGADWAKQIDVFAMIPKHAGRELKGIEKDGRIYFAFSEVEELGSNPFSCIVPVTDAKAFVDGLFPKAKIASREKTQAGYEKIVSASDTYYIIEKPNQVIIAGTEELANAYNGKYDALKTKQMGDAAAEAFFKADTSLFVNIDVVNEHYGEQITQFRAMFNQMIDQAAAGGAIPGMDKRQIELIKLTYAGIFQMMEDGKSFVLAAEIRETGVAVKMLGRFNATSVTGKILSAEKPSTLAGLGELPAGFANYTASVYGPEIAKLFSKIYREYLPAEGDEAGTSKWDEWSTLLAASSATTTASEIGKSSIASMEIKEPAKSVTTMIAAVKALGEGATYQNAKLKGKPTVTEADQTLRGMTFHKITLKIDFEESTKLLPEPVREAAAKSMKKLLPETTTMWVGASETRLLQVMAPDWSAAKAIIEKTLDQKSVASADPAFKAIRAALPNEATYIGLFDVAKTINFLGDYAQTIFGAMQGIFFGNEMPKLKTIQSDTAYAGLALTLKGDLATFELFVPTKAVSLVREAIQPLLDKE